MKKWFKRTLNAILVLAVLAVAGTYWLFRQAFGPLERTITIEISDNQTLVCKEIYTADLAAVFYDVDFKLVSRNETLELGTATFSTDTWNKDVKLYSIGDWAVLPVREGPYLKLLAANHNYSVAKDTVLNPHDLGIPRPWQGSSQGTPSRIYAGTSELESVDHDEFTVLYKYRIGNQEPLSHVQQKIKYQFDNIRGDLRVQEIFEPEEFK